VLKIEARAYRHFGSGIGLPFRDLSFSDFPFQRAALIFCSCAGAGESAISPVRTKRWWLSAQRRAIREPC
jgi:hypothetical protein